MILEYNYKRLIFSSKNSSATMAISKDKFNLVQQKFKALDIKSNSLKTKTSAVTMKTVRLPSISKL